MAGEDLVEVEDLVARDRVRRPRGLLDRRRAGGLALGGLDLGLEDDLERFSSLQEEQVTRTSARLPCWVSTLMPHSAMLSPHWTQRYRRAWDRSNWTRSMASV